MRNESAASRDLAYQVRGYSDLKGRREPLVIVRGDGIHVIDQDGKSYIEGLAGLWCTALGFGEERLAEAADKQMRRLPNYHGFGNVVPEITVDLAEKLIGLAPVPMSKVLFTNSGSEANDLAIKLIWYVNNALGRPRKKKLVSRLKGYHGVTVASGSLTGLPHIHADFDLPMAGVLHADCPHYYHYGEDGESEEDFATRCAENLDKLIVGEGPDTVAAFFAEPVMCAGGVIPPPATYFEKVQEVLAKHDVMLVADEVICGFGRTGNMWGSQTYGLKPDMMVTGKALSSGYLPISALMVSEPIYEAMVLESEKLGLFGHGSTYAGHPVAAAVALETIAIFEERDIVGKARDLAPAFQEALAGFADHPLVGEARGVGLVGGLELVKDKEKREVFDPIGPVGAYCKDRAQDHGLLIRAIGDVIAVCPPLVIEGPEVAELFARLGRALDDTAAWAADEGLI
ncbi:MAG: aminotransferase class III-fold pyridoxal phosphate-dependent enzyme [Proteobacteria bacterium]|nr:aminotransferase class III-fold pyridoxal phosphate-dependent enzyme [Pseudomonadota bacterium]